MNFWKNNKTDIYIQLYDDFASNLKTKTEISFLEKQFKKNQQIIELGCGTGRTLIPLTKKGYQISGLDFSKGMLNILKNKIREEKLPQPPIFHKDLTKFSLSKKFDGAILSQRTLNFITTPENQRKALINIGKIFKKDAKLIINLMPARPNDFSKSQKKLTKTDTFINSKTGKKVNFYENWIPDPLHQTWTLTNQFKESKNIAKTNMLMRVIFEQEMKYLLEICGFKVIAVYGNWKKQPYNEKATDLIFVTKKI